MPPRINAQEIQFCPTENEFERRILPGRKMRGLNYKLSRVSTIIWTGKDLDEAPIQKVTKIDISTFKETPSILKAGSELLRYRWVITYLFGAAPVAEQSFFDQVRQSPCVPSETATMSCQ